MKHLFQIVTKLFQGLVGKLLIIANFIICLVIFDWGEFLQYLETPSRVNCHIKPYSRGIDICTSGIFPSFIEPLLFFLAIIFFILVYPSMAMTEIVLGVLKVVFPLWCIETSDIIYIPVFALINAFYWLFLGDMIEILHSSYTPPKKLRINPLGLISND